MKRWVAAASAALALTFAAAPAFASPPTLEAVSAVNLRGISAGLKGGVNPQALRTTYYFEYATDPGFAAPDKSSKGEIPEGSVAQGVQVTMTISGLTPMTTYYYRLVAENADGTTAGTTGDSTAGSFETTAGFGFLPGAEGFSASVLKITGEDESHELETGAATEAESHPYAVSVAMTFNRGADFDGEPAAIFPDGDPHRLQVKMPAGMTINPRITPTCTWEEFHTPRSSPEGDPERYLSGENCPNATQLGTVTAKTRQGTRTFGLFNLAPPLGVFARLGSSPFKLPFLIEVGLEPNGDGSYTPVLEIGDIPRSADLWGLEVRLWGTPWEDRHDPERGSCLNEVDPQSPWGSCAGGTSPSALLTLPPQCSGSLTFEATASSWEQRAEVSSAATSRTQAGEPAQMSCPHLFFDPEVVGHLDNTRASSPAGFVFRASSHQTGLLTPGAHGPAPIQRLITRLPEGTTVNPSVADGLGVCTPAQLALETATNGRGHGCPLASQIGTVNLSTPLLEEPLAGAVYLARPDNRETATPGRENPFDSLVAVYLVVKSRERGLIVEIPGEIQLRPGDGTVTGVFENLPELPYEDLDVTFRSGQRSFLLTPSHCGYVETDVEAVPWGSAEPVDERSYTRITAGADGGPCPSGPPPFEPKVTAGAVNSNVNAFTPYFIHISREDTEQEITSYSLTLPRGVTGKLAGVEICPDAGIEAARAKRGFAEARRPSCPLGSQVGRTYTGYGVGSTLAYSKGKIYLAGPYHGAPLSLVTIDPATVGPFDLGTIVIRSAFQVDPHTAQLRLDSSASDPIPHIFDGVVLHLREIRIYMDRPEFTHNPSSCEASKLESRITGAGASFEAPNDDSLSTPSSFFQLLNCRILGFQPRLGVRLNGSTHRRAYPSLRVSFAARGPQDSNLKEIAVVIPRQEFLAQEHIRGICSRRQFAAEGCPADSVYGSAVAETPLLDQPLRGKVYLRSSTHAVPDLVADLRSGSIHIVLEGRIGPGGSYGGIRAFFTNLPDEPISRFVMTLYGGKRGLLQNSADICRRVPVASVKALAHNDVGAVFPSKLRGQCGRPARQAARAAALP